MNESMASFARTQIIEGLKILPESWQIMFKRMYSHTDLTLSIKEVVSGMPEEKLDIALSQVQRSVAKFATA